MMVRTERSRIPATDFEKYILTLEQRNEPINGMVYGDSNIGKTFLAGTCPGKTFWLIGEPGYKTAARTGARGHGAVITDTSMALAATDWLYAKDRYKRFDWLILDGLTTMQNRFRLAYAQEAFDADPRKRAHRNLPDRPDYFNTQNFLISWMPYLVDLPLNLLVTLHAYRTDKTENGELLVFPGIQGKVTEVANAISGLMDFTGYYTKATVKTSAGVKRPVRRLYFDTPKSAMDDGIRYICGSKYPAMGSHIDRPTIPMIMERTTASA